MEADVDEDRLVCLLCNARFERRKDFAVHVKSMKHQTAVAAAADRQALRDRNESKEASREEFRSRFFPRLQPVIAGYMEESQATLGGLYSPQARRVPCANLSESLSLLYGQTRARPHVVARRKALYKFVFRVCKILFPECKCDVYGSIPHKIDDESSDIDMSVRLEEGDATPAAAAAAVLDRVGKAVELAEAEHLTVVRVLHARIPVISIRDALTGTSLDLSMWNIDKLHISEIFAMYFEIDPRVRPIVYAVRKFSKRHQINDAFGGFVNSFGWTVAIVCFLMNRGLVPIMDVDSGPEANKGFRPSDADAPISTGDLLIQFLEWFLEWPYQTHRLSMRTPTGVTEKEADRFEDYTFVCIERPRTPFQNITRQVEKKQWTMIRNLLATALAKLKGGALIWDIL